MRWLARAGLAIAFPLLLLLAGCQGNEGVTRLSGTTMGTLWHVSVVDVPEGYSAKSLTAAIQQVLDEVNERFSTYRPSSDVERVNAAPVGKWVPVSGQVVAVARFSEKIYRDSGGAFNPAVGALVNLWGFGPNAPPEPRIPSDEAIAKARASIDYGKLAIRDEPPALMKPVPLTLDYSAVAKGYGVDRVAERLDELGVSDYLVEVGGEVRVRGHNGHGKPWRIGIDTPDVIGDEAYAAIAMSTGAVATSGDYRNYFDKDGKRYSHTIDPVTGRPITHNLASVTVIATTCMDADAVATAIDVLGPERGLAYAKKRALPVYLIVKTANGFEQRYSVSMKSYLRTPEQTASG